MRNNSAKNAEQCQIALILFRILFRNEGVYAGNCRIKGEKTLTFPCVFLRPEASYVPGMGEDHVARLIFKALPDPQTGKLFTFS